MANPVPINRHAQKQKPIIVLESGLPPREGCVVIDRGDHIEVTVEPTRLYETQLEDDNAALAIENMELKDRIKELEGKTRYEKIRVA